MARFEPQMDPLLAETISRYEIVAVRYVSARVRDPEIGRDIYQSVVSAVLASGKAFSSPDHLRNYFFTALRNAAVDFERSRRRSREVRLPDEADVLFAARAGGPQDPLIAEEEAVRQRRRIQALVAALEELPERERQVLRQRFWEGKTFREIQEATRTAISTLKSREDAALEKLKQALGKLADPP